MPPRLTTPIKVLLVLATLALGLSFWDFPHPKAPRPPTAGGRLSGSLEKRTPELPPVAQKVLATETKSAARPTLSPKLRRAPRQPTRSAWGRDPFALEVAHPKRQGEVRLAFAAGLHVLGIVWDTTRMHAIINGSVVRVGDEVEGFRIVAIERDRVTIAKGDQRQ